jgi:hypothetical protein
MSRSSMLVMSLHVNLHLWELRKRRLQRGSDAEGAVVASFWFSPGVPINEETRGTMMTPPRRKQHPQASSSSAPAQCQARLSPEILPPLSQEEDCRRQETAVLQLELSPIDAGSTHAIAAACRRSHGSSPPTQTRSPATCRGGLPFNLERVLRGITNSSAADDSFFS